MARQDPAITATLNKVVDTIRSLVSPAPSTSGAAPPKLALDRASPLASHLVVDDGRPYLDYIFSPLGPDEQGWEWNRGKYRTDNRTLAEIVDGLVKEAASIDAAQKSKATQYALVKGQLTVAARKQK